jgi:hypothetical protein
MALPAIHPTATTRPAPTKGGLKPMGTMSAPTGSPATLSLKPIPLVPVIRIAR